MSKDKWEVEFDEYWQSWDEEEDDFYLPNLVPMDVARRIWQTAYRAGGKQPWYSINKEQLRALMERAK